MFSARTTSTSFEPCALGEQVRALRRERGLTLKALGQRAGLSHPFLSQVERGLAQPSLGSVQRIAGALGVPVGQLWTRPSRLTDAQVIRRGEGLSAELHGATVREWTAGTRSWPAGYDTALGELLVYVARGAVEVDLDGTVHALGEGDALRFAGAVAHRLRRSGGPRTRVLLVAAG